MTPQKSDWPPAVPAIHEWVEIGDARDARWFLRRFGAWIALGGLLALGAAGVYSYFFPPVYNSAAKVRFMPPQVAGRFVSPNFAMEVEQRLFALSQLLRSRLTASKLIESQGLYPERRRFQAIADLTPSFQENLTIMQVQGGEGQKSREVPTLHIEFRYQEPAKAQAVVQKLIEQVYEENRKYRGDQSLGTTEFLTEQLSAAEESMLDAEARLGEIQESVGSTVSQTKLGQATSRSYVVDSRLRDVRHDQRLLEEKRMIKNAEFEQLELMHKRIETRPLEYYFSEVENMEPCFHQIGRVMSARSNANVLREKWQAGYPDLVAAENEEAQQVATLDRIKRDLAKGTKNRDLEANAAKLALARMELRALEKQSEAQVQEEKDLRAEAQQLREQLNAPPGQETELLSARREYDNAKEHYNQLLKKQEESKAASDLERRGQGETVELLEPASLPSESDPPKLWVRYGIGLGAGLVFSTILCCLIAFREPRILHAGHLENWASMPVLAVFDAPKTTRQWWIPKRLQGAASMVLMTLLMLLTSACSNTLMGPSGLVARGKAEERQGKLAGALIYYRQAIKQDSRYAPAYEAAALVALRMGELNPARDFLLRAVEFAPDNATLHKMLADVSYQVYFSDPGRPMTLLREVEAQAETLRRNWPKQADGYRIEAQVLMERHRMDEAAATLEKAIPHVKQNEALRAQLAAIQFRLGEATKSESVLRALMEEKPQYRDAYDILYLQLMQKQRVEDGRGVLEAKWKATQLVESALQLAAHDDAQGKRQDVRKFLASIESTARDERLGMAQLGDFWLHRGEWAQAKAAYTGGLEKEQGKRSDYVGRLAEWHLVQGQAAEAKALVEKELGRYPESPLLQAYASAIRLGQNSSDRQGEERRRLESILARMPESPFVRYHLGRAYMLENKVAAAADQFERAIKLDANYTAGWLALAELELSRGNASLAEARADAAIRGGQVSLQALLVKARSLVERRRHSEAEKIFRAVLTLDASNLEARYWQGYSLAAQGKFAEAEALFLEGAKQEPQNARWALARSAALSASGKLGEARKVLEKDAAELGQSEQLQARLASVQLSMQDGEAAQVSFQRLADAHPERLEYRLGLAAALVLTRKADRALGLYESMQKSHPNDVRVWVEPAALLDEMGRDETAIVFYREALKRDKDHPIALNNLAWKLLKQGKELQQALEYAQHAKRILQRAPEVDGTLAEAYTKLAMYRNATAVYEEMLTYVDGQNKARVQKLLEATRKLFLEKGKSA